MDHASRINRATALLTVATAGLALAAPASAQETFKLGIVTFLSGPAADSFGVPARNGGQFAIDRLNKGAAPAPYEKVGFGGMKIEPVIIDENGGAWSGFRNCATFMSVTMSMSCWAISAPAIASPWRR